MTEIEFDPSELRVNFSEEEASSEAIDFTPLPTGKYHAAITEVETRFSNSEKNKGKPYWAITFVVQSGPYENRKLWGNVMLFEGALYSLAQLMKSVGREDVLKNGQVPHPDELLGQELTLSVVKTKDTYRMERDGTDEPIYKNEIKGYKPLTGSKGESSGGGSSSLMP